MAVMRRNGEKAKDYAQRHGVPKWYDNADQLINDPDVNAIYIATPPDSHEAYTLKAAKAGKFDLLILGSHGHGALVNLVMGSVATQVLAGCTVPVLVVR